jgi:hypothetical protein
VKAPQWIQQAMVTATRTDCALVIGRLHGSVDRESSSNAVSDDKFRPGRLVSDVLL